MQLRGFVMAVLLFRLPFFWKEKVPPVSTKKNLVETDKHCFQFPPLVRGREIAKRKKEIENRVSISVSTHC
jgi:hypothetical protein